MRGLLVFCFVVLLRLYVRSLSTLRALGYLELNGLTFVKRLESVALNLRVMNKYVFAAFLLDEAEALGLVEPLYCSCYHSA